MLLTCRLLGVAVLNQNVESRAKTLIAYGGHVKFHEIEVWKMMIPLKCSLVTQRLVLQIFSKGMSVVTVLNLKFGMNLSLSFHHNFVNQNSNKYRGG